MPRFQVFNNRQVLEPGSYTAVKGGDKAAPSTTATGKVLIIDTGIGAGFGGGAGALGTKYNGKKAIYGFTDPDEYKEWVRGGVLWDITQRLFKPSKDRSIRGCEELLIIQARNSTPAALTIKFGALVGGVPSPNGGTVVIKTHAEGTGANGVLNTGKLVSGFAGKVVAAGTGKLKVMLYVGTYKGLDINGVDINNESSAVAAEKPRFITETPAFSGVNELLKWMRSNQDFQEDFYLEETGTSVVGTGVHGGVSDIGVTLSAFTGATESYDAAALDEAIESIQELDNTFFLCDKFGVTDGVGVENTKIFTAMTTLGVYERFMVVGGGKDKSQYAQASTSSFAMAAYFNSPYVYVAHSDIYEKNRDKAGFRKLNTFYAAATLAGRLAGAAPQTPLTWKDLDIDGVEHELKLKEREDGLKAGVIHYKEVGGQLVINQEVNTMQLNDEFVYASGASPEGSIMRISAALNKDLKKKTEQRFTGSNIGTYDPADVKSYIEQLLIESTANKQQDNLIVSYRDVKVTLVGGDYKIQYGFVANGPINRLFITGYVFSPNTTI